MCCVSSSLCGLPGSGPWAGTCGALFVENFASVAGVGSVLGCGSVFAFDLYAFVTDMERRLCLGLGSPKSVRNARWHRRQSNAVNGWPGAPPFSKRRSIVSGYVLTILG
jgi:hypothetical protein